MPKSFLRDYLDYYFKSSKTPLKKIVLLLTQYYTSKLKKPIHERLSNLSKVAEPEVSRGRSWKIKLYQ